MTGVYILLALASYGVGIWSALMGFVLLLAMENRK